MPSLSNAQVAELLRSVAAAYQIKGVGNVFQIRAYENAATSIEHATQDVHALWQEGKIDDIPGIGKGLTEYLNELFTKGSVKHFDDVLTGIPEAALAFLNIPGVGPKTAYKLAVEGHAGSIDQLKQLIESGKLQKAGFSDKAVANLARGISQMEGLTHRLLLPEALFIAEQLISDLKTDSSVLEAYPLGSLRRMVPTIGDIDLAVSTTEPEKVIKTFISLDQVREVTDQGETKSSVILKNGLQIDLMTGHPRHFGSLLQHFTGSKAHNIHFREIAKTKGWSVSEYGLKNIKSGQMKECTTEQEVYQSLGMLTPPPEIREDSGEIEAALKHSLPNLIELGDIKGDLHTHTSYSDGFNSVIEMAELGLSLGYRYLALTDHSYPNLEFDNRNKEIDQYNYSNKDIRVIKGLEINITSDNKLQISDEIIAKHEFNIASIHSSFSQSTDQLTDRILMAIQHPLINMIGHPTGRLLGERQGYELDWEKVFNAAEQYDKILEIDGYPTRSDLPDQLIREAIKRRIKLSVDTDAHRTDHLSLMKFGIALARRGWATPDLVINTWPLQKLLDYLKPSKIK